VSDPASEGARLRFAISSDRLLEVTAPGDEIGFPSVTLGQPKAFQSQLLAFKDAVGEELTLAPDRTSAALETLRLKTNALASDLLGSLDVFDRLAELCYRALPASAARVDGDVQVVDVEAPQSAFEPLELLPLLDLRWPAEPSGDQRDIEDAASSFLGFAAVVRRLPPASLDPEATLRNEPTLAVGFIRDGTMPGSSDELDLLKELGHLDLTAPWPDGSVTSVAVARDLAASLFGGTRGDGTAVEVHHFACHVFSSRGPAQSWSLRVGSADSAAEVTIEELLVRLRDLRKRAASPPRPKPLVFMNACGSSTIVPSSTISFPWVALQNGNRAFIGTETRIPDAFAAQFSKVFYQQLLLGATAGVALHSARWQMLRRYGNPLGLLYSLYGDADLRIAHPIPKESMYV
jgi:hypothetical protein